MNCIFDYCELINGIVLGIISAAIFAYLYHLSRQYFYYKRKFGKIAGDFRGYGYADQTTGRLTDKPISKATIEFFAENKLHITVSHGENFEYVWKGEITMNSLKHGGIVWQYVQPLTIKHFFGFKQCIVEDDFQTVILIGEESQGYGKEILKRK